MGLRCSTDKADRLAWHAGAPPAPGITLAGPLDSVGLTVTGAAGAAVEELVSLYATGRPVHVARPDLPPSLAVSAPSGDPRLMLLLLGLVMPRLLVLDGASAWADPTEPRGQVTPLAFVPHDPYRAQLAALAAQVRARVPNDRDELLGNVAVLARVHASAAVDA